VPSCKRYKQLKLSVDVVSDHYEDVPLTFSLQNQYVSGILNGTVSDWNFRSPSPVFLKFIPSGVLYKYAFWIGEVPSKLSDIYNGIFTAASKAGYCIIEMEEIV